MRRKRKIFYQVSIPGKWWCGKGNGWMKNPEGDSSNIKDCETFKRAIRHASNYPEEAIITRIFYKKGKRYIQEFYFEG